MTNVLMRVASRPTERLPVHPWLGDRLVWACFVHAPYGQTHAFPPRYRPARSAFFRAGVRILDFDFATLALADGHAGLAPRPVALPGDAGIVQHRPDGVRTDVGQSIRCAPQGALQGIQGPGRGSISLAIRWAPKLLQDPIAVLGAILGRWTPTGLAFQRCQANLVEPSYP